jgi:hypothetical protein
MHSAKEKVSALEYAVLFLIEREEKKILSGKGSFLTADNLWDRCNPEEFQTLARLEDLRAEIKLHMTEKETHDQETNQN